MRLTSLLRVSFPIKRNWKGLKYEGKNQAPKYIKTTMKYDYVNKMMQQEQNIKYLMNPCVSMEEERVYGSAHPERKVQRFKQFIMDKRKPFYPDRSINEQFHKNLAKLKTWE
ncbi:hypothetical protein ACF0H5_012336 [Mactra antiquata]